ncbi:O-methyltransferase [Naviculisporaceae sp. PSN 640]
MASNDSLQSLGSKIARLSATLSQQLHDGKHPQPSFSADGPSSYPRDPHISQSRSELLDALLEMTHLVTGPESYWAGILNPATDIMAVSVLQRFDFFSAVPLNGSASYAEIAKAVKLPEQIVRRFIRVAFASQIFAIDPPDRVRHNAFSAEAVRKQTLHPFLEYSAAFAFPMLTRGADAIERYFAGRSEPNDDLHACPFSMTLEPDGSERGVTLWEYYEKNPEQAKLFAGTIQHLNSLGVMNSNAALDVFDWAGLGEDVTVVDVGGSSGHVSLYLSQRYPNLKKFIVQDKPAVEGPFNALIPPELVKSGRISFETHDFFDPEETPADIYLLKSVLHDWPDSSAIQILRNVVPALEREGKKPAKLLLVESVVSTEYDAETGKPTVPLHVRKHVAGMDMMLFTLCNARDRTLRDWKALVERADIRLEIVKVGSLPGMLFSTLEIVLNVSGG